MRRSRCRGPVRRQRGVILFIALIVLVAMSLAGIALMRSVDTNVLIAGNLAFRQGATSVADRGIEAAKKFLADTAPANLWDNRAADAYFATWEPNSDLYGRTVSTTDDFNWGTAISLGLDPLTGNEVRYVIHRICEGTDNPSSATANCVRTTSSSAGSATGAPKGAVSYSQLALAPATTVYYRVTVRVTGPRNTLSYVQAVLK